MAAEGCNQGSEVHGDVARFFDTAPGIFLILSLDGIVLRANRTAADLVGLQPEEFLGRSVTEFVQECDLPALYRARDDVSYGSMTSPVVLNATSAGGAVRTISWVGSLCNDGALYVVGTDITTNPEYVSRDSVDAQMRQAQKLESIGTLASGVAHEINNPLNSILNYAQLIIDDAPAGADAAEFAGEIITESSRLAKLVRNLLTFARTDAGDLIPASPADVLESALSLTRASMRRDMITLEEEVEEWLPEIWCRPQQIQQVILNLVLNARDALNEQFTGRDPGKRIRVTLKSDERDGAQWVALTVTDQGAGVPDALTDRIFGPFFSTKPAGMGTGLGLSISYGIVRDHGGTLTLQSGPGRGASFCVRLPVRPEGAPEE
jgi:PAS domain S-box-containing protein